jgi:uncharacterized membrane protein YfcA
VVMIIESTIGFGGSIILIPIISIFVSIQTAIVLMALWGLTTDSFKIVNFRKFLDKQYIKVITLSAVPGTIIGSLLINVVPVTWLKLMLGIFILGYAILKIIGSLKTRSDEKKEVKPLKNTILYFGGVSYGFFSGLIGVSGPINVALLERTGHEREAFIGNFAGSSILMTIFKIIIYTSTGLFPSELWLLIILGIPVLFCSSRIGKYLALKIPKKIFKTVVFILLIIISVYIIIQSIV